MDHCFALSDGSPSGMCNGISGIMQAYNAALSRVTLSGPTLFSQIIQQACAIAASAGCTQESQKYFVLLIITDGEQYPWVVGTVVWLLGLSFKASSSCCLKNSCLTVAAFVFSSHCWIWCHEAHALLDLGVHTKLLCL